jgi:hypothetical protein
MIAVRRDRAGCPYVPGVLEGDDTYLGIIPDWLSVLVR